MIIDSHAHWLPQEIIKNAHFFSSAWGDIETHLKMMEGAGITQAVLSYPSTDAYLKLGSSADVVRIYNEAISKILKRYPKAFIGAAILPIGDSDSMLAELKRTTQEWGFKAISLASSYQGVYLDDPIFLPVYNEAQAKGIPIFVHAQIVNPIGFERVQDPLLTPVVEYVFDTTMCIGKLLMSDILKDYPKLKFIFAHFGGAVPFLVNRFDDTYQMLRGINFVKDLKDKPSAYLKNIYVDTSGDKVKSNFLAALELFGPGHLLWGSDWPAKKDISGSISAVRSLDIPETDKETVLGGNLRNILENKN
jgi:predicted TIM-barrel fold metal-dependent hydrolase